MICCSFVFQAGEYDEEFTRLDNAIDVYAKALDGYIKVEKWFSPDKKTQNSMYYFTDMETVDKLAKLPAHLTAKEKVDRWYIDYTIEVFEVLKTYGKTTKGLLPELLNNMLSSVEQ